MVLTRPATGNLLSALGVIIAALLMVPVFQAGPLVLDEHAAYWLSAPGGALSIWERSARYAAAPPLASWFQAASMGILGETEAALRLPSVLAYLAAVALMAFGFRRTLGGTAAALAACALALHPDVVDEVRVGRTYGLVVLWTTALLLITLGWRSTVPRRRDGVLWGLAAAAAVWTHILTIPVVAISASALLVCDVRLRRSLCPATVLGWGLAAVLCLPLVPMGERIWEWRHALNYQTGGASLGEALGPVVWLSLPLAAVAALYAGGPLRRAARRMGEDGGSADSRRTPGAIGICAAIGLIPLCVLVIAGQGDLSSLAHPRYRVPLAAASSCLLGLLCSRQRRPSFAVGCLSLCLMAAWVVVGRSPLQLVRLATPQAPVWKQMAETLEETVAAQHLEQAPVFVQSGLIEATLIPAFPEDMHFHAYVSSRLGRFYAPTENPRYSLPMFWGGDNAAMIAFFDRTLRQAAATPPDDVFVAVAVDTDINRASFATFVQFLDRFGYKGTLISGEEPWAALYRFKRAPPSSSPSDSERPPARP